MSYSVCAFLFLITGIFRINVCDQDEEYIVVEEEEYEYFNGKSVYDLGSEFYNADSVGASPGITGIFLEKSYIGIYDKNSSSIGEPPYSMLFKTSILFLGVEIETAGEFFAGMLNAKLNLLADRTDLNDLRLGVTNSLPSVVDGYIIKELNPTFSSLETSGFLGVSPKGISSMYVGVAGDYFLACAYRPKTTLEERVDAMNQKITATKDVTPLEDDINKMSYSFETVELNVSAVKSGVGVYVNVQGIGGLMSGRLFLIYYPKMFNSARMSRTLYAVLPVKVTKDDLSNSPSFSIAYLDYRRFFLDVPYNIDGFQSGISFRVVDSNIISIACEVGISNVNGKPSNRVLDVLGADSDITSIITSTSNPVNVDSPEFKFLDATKSKVAELQDIGSLRDVAANLDFRATVISCKILIGYSC